MAEVLGLIPARGGSKSIPHKNLAPLLGRPLLAYTAEAARDSKRLGRTVLSTDDADIAHAGKGLGLEVPYLRPPELASDDAPMLAVVQHMLRHLEQDGGYRPDAVVLLQPTSPLRRAEHIDEAIDILLSTGGDSVVSVVTVPHHYNPVSLMCLVGQRLAPYVEGPLVLRRQEKPKVYARNGPVVLVTRREVLLAKDSLYGDDCRPYFMSDEDSLDIDTPLDLELAEFFLKRLERLQRESFAQSHTKR